MKVRPGWVSNSRNGSYGTVSGTAPRSLRLGARGLDHLAPLVGLFGDELCEIGGRAGERRGAQIGKPRLHFGVRKNGVDLLVELVDDLCERALAQTDGEPLARLVAGYQIAHCRESGQFRKTRG